MQDGIPPQEGLAGDHTPNAHTCAKRGALHESHLNSHLNINLKFISFSVILKGLGPVALDTSSGLCAFSFTSLCGKQFLGDLCLPGGVGLSRQLCPTPATRLLEPRTLLVGGHSQSAPTSCSQTLWLMLEGLTAGTVIAG